MPKPNPDGFFQRAKEVHGDRYDYSKTTFVNLSTKVVIICPIHGSFIKCPKKHTYAKEGCQECGRIEKIQANCRFKTNQEVYNECHILHSNVYTYTTIIQRYPEYIASDDEIVCNCSVHGEFTQTINKHIYGKTGCPKCGELRTANSVRKTTDMFIKTGIQLFGNEYDYSKSIYTLAHNPITITCKIHGDFVTTASNHIHGVSGCPLCRASGPEIAIMKILNDLNIAYTYQKTFPGLVGTTGKKLRYDFYLHDKKAVIEFDGIYHFQPINHGSFVQAQASFTKMQQYDKIKNIFLASNNISLLRIHYKDVRKIKPIIEKYLMNN